MVSISSSSSDSSRASFSKEQLLELLRTANRVYDALEAFPQTAIVALNGAARAGAAELSLACDIHRRSAGDVRRPRHSGTACPAPTDQ